MIRTFAFWNISAYVVAMVTALALSSPWWIVPIAAQAAFVAGLIIGRHVVGRA